MTGVLVVEQSRRVAIGVTETCHSTVVSEVGVHPGQPLGVRVPRDDVVVGIGPIDRQSNQGELPDRQAVVEAG